jgi:hypothetical protein
MTNHVTFFSNEIISIYKSITGFIKTQFPADKAAAKGISDKCRG